jgi:predicted transcriptional regulator
MEDVLSVSERRQRLRDDALAAWTEYQETGLHLTGTEVNSWFARIEAGEDPDLPAPHE